MTPFLEILHMTCNVINVILNDNHEKQLFVEDPHNSDYYTYNSDNYYYIFIFFLTRQAQSNGSEIERAQESTAFPFQKK